MNKVIDEVLQPTTIENRYLVIFSGWMQTVSAFQCLISGKIPLNPVILSIDGGLYERDVLASIIKDQGGYFESPKTGNMIEISENNLAPTPESMWIKHYLDKHFETMWMFKDLRHTSDQDKLIELLCTKGEIEEDELEMRSYAIKKILTANPAVAEFNMGIYFGVQTDNLLELLCRFPLVQHPNHDNRCITSTLFYSTIEALKKIKDARGTHKSLFEKLRHNMLRHSGRDVLAQCLSDRLSCLLHDRDNLDMNKITLLQKCGASLMVTRPAGLTLLHTVLRNDLNDIVKIFLRSETLPIQELHATFKLAVEKVNLSTTTPLIQVLYRMSKNTENKAQLDMFNIVAFTINKYLENEGSIDDQKWRDRLDLVINLMPENEKVQVLNSTISVGEHQSLPIAWHAVNARSIWLLDCVLHNGALFFFEGDLKHCALYRAIEVGDDQKLQLMFDLVPIRGLNQLCSGKLFDKKTEKSLLKLTYGVQDTAKRESIYRTLFTAGIRYHDSAFSIFMDRNRVHEYFDSVEHDRVSGIKRIHSTLLHDRYSPNTFFFADTEIETSTQSNEDDSEDTAYQEHQSSKQQENNRRTQHADDPQPKQSTSAWMVGKLKGRTEKLPERLIHNQTSCKYILPKDPQTQMEELERKKEEPVQRTSTTNHVVIAQRRQHISTRPLPPTPNEGSEVHHDDTSQHSFKNR